jgi:hypothetical protein
MHCDCDSVCMYSEVVANPTAARDKGLKGQAHIRTKYSNNVVGRLIANQLARIGEKIKDGQYYLQRGQHHIDRSLHEYNFSPFHRPWNTPTHMCFEPCIVVEFEPNSWFVLFQDRHY